MGEKRQHGVKEHEAMRSVLVMDRSFASRERSLLSRLEIGLADEGVRVAHAVPPGMVAREGVGLYSTAATYVDRGLPFSLGQRAEMLCEQLRTVLDLGEGESIEVVHALGEGFRAESVNGLGEWINSGWVGAGGGTWGMALHAAARLKAGLVVEVWAGKLIGAAVQLEHKARALGVETTYLAGDEAIASVLQGRLRRGTNGKDGGSEAEGRDGHVRLCPWGVHVRGEELLSKSAIERGGVPAVALLANGAAVRVVQAILEGVSRIGEPSAGKEGPDKAEEGDGEKRGVERLMVFVGANGRLADMVWKMARRLRILDRVTIVPEMESQREPILEMDVLILPGQTGMHHSLMLDAMGAGMVVVAGPDSMVSCVNDDSMVERVHTPTSAPAWTAAVNRVLTDREHQKSLTAAARAWVGANRSASAYVAGVLRAYAEIAERAARTRQVQTNTKEESAAG